MKKFGIFAACAISAALCLALFGCGGGAKEDEGDDIVPAGTTSATTSTTEQTPSASSSTPSTPAATSTSDNPFVTTWQMLSGIVAGEEYTASMLTQANQMGMGVDFVVNADGTYQMINAGNVLMEGTWTGDANGINLVDKSGTTAVCTLKGSIMTYKADNGDECKFSKKAQ